MATNGLKSVMVAFFVSFSVPLFALHLDVKPAQALFLSTNTPTSASEPTQSYSPTPLPSLTPNLDATLTTVEESSGTSQTPTVETTSTDFATAMSTSIKTPEVSVTPSPTQNSVETFTPSQTSSEEPQPTENISASTQEEDSSNSEGSSTPTEDNTGTSPSDSTATDSPLATHSPTPTPNTDDSGTLNSNTNQEGEIQDNLAEEDQKFATNELIIKFEESIDISEASELVKKYGFIKDAELSVIGIYVVDVSLSSIDTAMTDLQLLETVVFIELNYYFEIAETIPNDSSFPDQYAYDNINAPEGWDLSTGDDSVVIAVLDTGADYSHPDLAGNLLQGVDIVNSDDFAQDDNGHGTMVAGIAAAVSDNEIGVSGTSWNSVILPVKVLNSFGGGSYADVASGIIWAVNNDADVLNLSLGGRFAPSSQALLEAINYAAQNNVVIVAAAGNGSTTVFFPAAFDQVIAVASTDEGNAVSGFSNYGPEVDVAAPGDSIISTSLGGDYQYRSGTSMSTPFVAGLAALIKSVNPFLTPTEVEEIIEMSALDLGAEGFDIYYGHGLIQIDEALRLAISMLPDSQTAESSRKPRDEDTDKQDTVVDTPLELASPDSSNPGDYDVFIQNILELNDLDEDGLVVGSSTESEHEKAQKKDTNKDFNLTAESTRKDDNYSPNNALYLFLLFVLFLLGLRAKYIGNRSSND